MGYSHNHHRRILFVALTSALLVISTAIVCSRARGETSSWKIEGTVRDSVNSPIAGALVRVKKSGASISQETLTDTAGRFMVAATNAGTYWLHIQKPGFRDRTQSIVVPPKDPGPLDIVLVRSEPHPASGKSSEPMQFSDSTDFTVAGVTDWTAAGGHGSDVNLRTGETLAKETRELAGEASISATPGKTAESELLRKRDELQKMLATSERADLHRQLGDIDEQMNDSLAAVHEYERATQLDPSEQNYFAWATELLLHRAIQPSVEVFTKGAASYRNSERMLAGLGAALYASGLYAQAAERLCAASDLKPEDSTPYLFLGKMTLASAQPLPCAKEKLARFLRDQPQNSVANYYYALALWRETGNTAAPQQVESLLDKSISIDPKFADAYLHLGIVYSARGEMEKAVDGFQKAIAANPNLAEAHFRLGQAYKKVGEASKARQEFQAYERLQKTEAADVEQRRREIQQFVVVYKDKPPVPTAHTP